MRIASSVKGRLRKSFAWMLFFGRFILDSVFFWKAPWVCALLSMCCPVMVAFTTTAAQVTVDPTQNSPPPPKRNWRVNEPSTPNDDFKERRIDCW